MQPVMILVIVLVILAIVGTIVAVVLLTRGRSSTVKLPPAVTIVPMPTPSVPAPSAPGVSAPPAKSDDGILSGGSSSEFASDAARPGKTKPKPGDLVGKMAMTVYSFEDNTPCNSASSSSGNDLIPYVSVAVQFRFLTDEKGGPLSIGDQLHVKFLEGRTMPDGTKHTGWVQIDDFCGDMGDDSYCSQSLDSGVYPNIDLYIGSWADSGAKCTGGDIQSPGGNGQELTEIRMGPAPSGQFRKSYGGKAKGPGKCNDCVDACVRHTGLSEADCRAEIGQGSARDTKNKKFEDACWWYTPQFDKKAKGWCDARIGNMPAADNGGLGASWEKPKKKK